MSINPMATAHVWIYYMCVGWWLITSVDSQGGYYQLNLTGKATQQSSTQGDLVSSRAVDGNPNSLLMDGSCTHSGSAGLEWWAVDLESVHPIYSVTLVNRADCCEERLDNFRVYGYNNTFDPDQNDEKETCAELSGDFGEIGTRTFVCRYIVHSRFVGVQLTKPNFLSLCEVYIHAACELGRYGENCTNSCSEHCKFNPCDRVTGVCPNKTCTAGFKGETCDTSCEPGRYGENCTSFCSKHCNFNPCDRVTGVCPNGACIAGFKGETCDTSCPDGQYGENCINTCPQNCRHFPCDKGDGYCPSGGCIVGFDGVRCNEKCPAGTFGVKCLSECFPNCKDVCHHVDGSCRPGCKKGWTGEKCQIKDDGTLVIVLAVLLAVFVVLCLGGMLLFMFRRCSKTAKIDKKRELTNTEAAYVNALHNEVLEMRDTEINTETKYEDVTKKIEEGEITSSCLYEKLEQVQTELKKVYEELHDQE